jgi:predicted TIM-barrel fold metal-dependent hydrolase
MTTQMPAEETVETARGTIVDADIHNTLKSPAVLKDYMPRRWHVHLDQGPPPRPAWGAIQVPARPSAYRHDSFPSDGVAASEVSLFQEQLLDECGVGKAILHPVTEVDPMPQYGDYGAAYAAAINEWMRAEWIEQDDRLYAGITVAAEDGERAAREVERLAAEPGFVKVALLVRTREPAGHPKYWPIYEAAVEHGLPVSFHAGGPGGSGSPAGWIDFHAEYRVVWASAFAAQMTSLVYSGVFDHLPSLQVVMEEGGLGWFPPLLWRLDRAWAAMPEQVPHLTEPPSQIARRHFWLTTQPLEEPEKPEHLAHLFDQLDLDDHILFSSDYPHHDFDDPRRVLRAVDIGASRREKILGENAAGLFRFR